MAGRREQRQLAAKLAPHRFFSPPAAFSVASPDADEFDESEVWSYCAVDPGKAEEPKPPATASRPSAAQSKGGDGRRGDRVGAPPASSLPVNIPDWSKVLGSYYSGGGSSSSRKGWYGADDEVGEISAGPLIPPHELLCRSRAASCSVHEGVGRKLKGRDLSRVRNAIWEKTGFQD